MRRKYFFAVALMSLLLSAGTVWWWTNSATRMNQFTFRQSDGDTLRVLGCDGKLLLTRTLYVSEQEPHVTQLTWTTIPYSPGADKNQPDLKWSAFTYSKNMKEKGVIESSLVLPVWAITAVCSIIPLMWFHSKLKLAKKLAA